MTPAPEDSIGMLRHTLATLAYRAGKALRGAPAEFATFRAGPETRTPGEILAHMGDLLDWALVLAEGRHEWRDCPPAASWDGGVARFFDRLDSLDRRIASGGLGCTPERLFQGPIADALTHVGQIAMLRRLVGAAIRGENYFVARIAAGNVGVNQAEPRKEFD